MLFKICEIFPISFPVLSKVLLDLADAKFIGQVGKIFLWADGDPESGESGSSAAAGAGSWQTNKAKDETRRFLINNGRRYLPIHISAY